MSFPSLLLSLSIFWLAVHGLHAYLKRGSAPRPSSARAFAGLGRAYPFGLFRILSSTQVSLRGVRLQLSTQAWNEPHDRLSGWLLKRKNRSLREGLKRCYDVGVVLGVAGMIVACGGLLWVACSHASSVYHWWNTPTPAPAVSLPSLSKRNIVEIQGSQTAEPIPIRMIVRLSSF